MEKNWSNIIAKGIVKAVFSLWAVVIIIWFLYQIRVILAYILVALVVSLIGRLIKNFLIKRFKIKDTLASSITLFIILSVFICLFYIFVPMLIKQAQNLSAFDFKNFEEKTNILVNQIKEYLHFKNIYVFDQFTLNNIISEINLKFFPELLNSIISFFGNFIMGVFAVSFISFFMLKENQLTTNFLFKLIPDNNHHRFQEVFTKIKDLLSRYFVGISIQIFVLFIFYTLLLNFLDVENATLIALIAALLNLIPYIGPIVGWIIMTSLAMTSQLQILEINDLILLAQKITAGYIIIQIWDNLVNIPLIYSKSVKAHPLEIFLIILIAGSLFGVLGMLVAVPVYTMIRIFFKEFYQEYKNYFTIW